jgi:protein-L-isoaspartate(D-aspartate) O-methyltransferase
MSEDYEALRERMVASQIEGRGIRDPCVLGAMRKVPRHVFVPKEMRPYAYADEPLPIGQGQTISQPYIVAYMTEALELAGGEKVLEVGTGSGYQTAVLAELAAEVWTVELVESLSLGARARLEELGYANIRFRVGDGSRGWPEAGPFDAIMVTAAPGAVPTALETQLAVSGRMIIPVGVNSQELVLVQKEKSSFRRDNLIGVRFVPLISKRLDRDDD